MPKLTFRGCTEEERPRGPPRPTVSRAKLPWDHWGK